MLWVDLSLLLALGTAMDELTIEMLEASLTETVNQDSGLQYNRAHIPLRPVSCHDRKIGYALHKPLPETIEPGATSRALIRGIMSNQGRPKKIRPERGSPITPGMSMRDTAAALGISRQQTAQWVMISNLPEDEFERVLKSPEKPTSRKLELLARRRTRKRTQYLRRCPHCGRQIRIEGEGL